MMTRMKKNYDGNNLIRNKKTTTTRSFQYKTEIIGTTPNVNIMSDAKLFVHKNIWVIFGDLLMFILLIVKESLVISLPRFNEI